MLWSLVQRRRIRHRIQHGDDTARLEDPETHSNHSKERVVVRSAGDDDPLNPLNWPLSSRCKNTAILCLLVFVQAWAGASTSAANTAASHTFGVSKHIEDLSTAMYLFGVGSGALVVGPLSETVGRSPTYVVATGCYLCFVLGTALAPSFGAQIVCRYFVGVFASATLAINGSSVRDQFRPVKRAFVFPIIAWANVATPMLAPVAGGWIVSNPHLTWRWTEWVTLIISGFAFVIALFFLPETYYPLLLDWKARELNRVVGNTRYTSEYAQKESFMARLRRTILLPATFFKTEPVILALGLYLVLLYTLLFTFLTGFEYIFKKTYMLSDGLSGSCFASVAAGATAFTVSAPALFHWSRQVTGHVHGATLKPEFRLWPAVVTAPLLPASLFWLGWTNDRSISIWSDLAACFAFGVVIAATYVGTYEYIIDSYGDHSAIALASITMVRYLVAGAMVMAARPMYEGIGVHWTMTLLGCLALPLAAAPYVLWRVGPRLRAKSPYAISPDEDHGYD